MAMSQNWEPQKWAPKFKIVYYIKHGPKSVGIMLFFHVPVKLNLFV